MTQVIDEQIGRNIRLRRIALKLSQKDLADRLELTFQQVQKYEKGFNRIALSRAYQIAQILDCRVSDLLDGVEGDGLVASAPAFSPETARAMQIYDQLPNSAQRATLAVLKAFYAAHNGDDSEE